MRRASAAHDVLSRSGQIGLTGRSSATRSPARSLQAKRTYRQRAGERVVLYQAVLRLPRNCLRGRRDLCRYGRVLGEQDGEAMPNSPVYLRATRSILAMWTRRRPLWRSSDRHQRARGARPSRRPSRDKSCSHGAGGGLGLRKIKSPKRTSARDRGHQLRRLGEIIRRAGADGSSSARSEIFGRGVAACGQAKRRRRIGNMVTGTFGESLRSCSATVAWSCSAISARPVGLTRPRHRGAFGSPAPATRPSRTCAALTFSPPGRSSRSSAACCRSPGPPKATH